MYPTIVPAMKENVSPPTLPYGHMVRKVSMNRGKEAMGL
jgi:hypothetical protein